MGANLTKEYASTWDQEDVKKWKESAAQILKSYYLSFDGSQFDEYMINEDENLLLAKICYAIYGSPTVENAEYIWDGYTKEQRENGTEILKIILEAHNKKRPSAKQVLVGIIFIAIKHECSEYVLPIFSIFTGHDPENPYAARSYVDTQKRIYENWEDWKSNNTMPMLKYAFPRRGFFTASKACKYEFDAEKDPDIEYGTSPACDLSSRIFGTTDVVTGLTALGCGVIGVASMLTPIGPAILLTTAIAGSSSAVYGTSRAVVRLVDKGNHGESLTDLESFTLWFSIAATPLHFATSIVNAQLARGAVVNGRIFSNSMRMFATVLNLGTFGVDSVMLGFGIANLVDKAKKDQLTTLDVLQFSMSVFFFTSTLVQPKTATAIIKKAQETHIQSYANNLSDADAKSTFDKFLSTNKGDGSIKDTSKIVRTINKINDPNAVFGGLKDSTDIKIGGRKGNTLLVGDKNQQVNRINPNKVTFTTISQGVTPVQLRNNVKTSLKASKLENFEVDGKRIFDNLDNRTKARANKTISGAAGLNQHILDSAKQISEKMDLKTPGEVLSVVEIVAAQVKKENPGLNMKNVDASHLKSINTPSFIEKIQNDCRIATEIANKSKVKFDNPLLAAYHYHKHGEDFPAVIKNQKIEVYLTKVPASIIQDGNLTNIETVNNADSTSFIRKTYITPQDKFAVVIEKLDQKTISTMFEYSNAFKNHKVTTVPNWSFKLFGGVAEQLSQSMGFPGTFTFLINFDKPEETFEWKEQ